MGAGADGGVGTETLEGDGGTDSRVDEEIDKARDDVDGAASDCNNCMDVCNRVLADNEYAGGGGGGDRGTGGTGGAFSAGDVGGVKNCVVAVTSNWDCERDFDLERRCEGKNDRLIDLVMVL